MQYEPLISNVNHLKGYDLLVDFTDGSSKIMDMSETMALPIALPYRTIDAFKNFGFDILASLNICQEY
jgi:hypothetical protein